MVELTKSSQSNANPYRNRPLVHRSDLARDAALSYRIMPPHLNETEAGTAVSGVQNPAHVTVQL